MKLYLSSLGIPNPKALTKLVGKSGTINVASIRNAWEPYSEERQKEFAEYIKLQQRSINANYEHVDLADYQDNEQRLSSKLKEFDLIWLHGGNTFVLNYRIQQSGFHRIIGELLGGGLVLGGDSAGAVVATPTLHGIELADKPSDAPEVYFNGLGLVKFGIIPHWGLDKYKEVMTDTENEMKRHVDKVQRLTDDDFIVVDDGLRTLYKGDEGSLLD